MQNSNSITPMIEQARPPQYVDQEHRVLQEAVDGGLPVHDMPVEATSVLSEVGIYTTTAPRPVESFHDFREDAKRDRDHDVIAGRLYSLLGDTAEFGDAAKEERLGASLAETFGAVTAIDSENVHVENPKQVEERIEGTVVAEKMTFTVRDAESARKLNVALQGMLRSPKGFYPVTMDPGGEDRLPSVQVHEMNEHTIRSVGRALGALVAQEDRKAGITLPPEKRSLAYWKAHGETFPPELEERLEVADGVYLNLTKKAEYPGYADVTPIIRDDYHLIGTDAAPMLQGVRDIFNGLIWEVRGGSHYNREQDPDRDARLLIEEGIELRRRKVAPTERYYGPPTSRSATSIERARGRGEETLRDARRNLGRTALRLAVKSVGFVGSTVFDAGLNLVEYAPGAAGKAKQVAGDRRAWKRHRQAVKDTGKRVSWYSTWHSTERLGGGDQE